MELERCMCVKGEGGKVYEGRSGGRVCEECGI